MKTKRKHKEGFVDVPGELGNIFRVILRQGLINPLDFSVILGYKIPWLKTIFRLRRYNGKGHSHSNPIEKEDFYNFHVHLATQRYQEQGSSEDAYAKRSDDYDNIDQAIECLLRDCNFVFPEGAQGRLF